MFQVGEFRTYESTKDVHLGSVENFQLRVGDEFQYDGVTLRLPDGRSMEMTQLRTGVQKGWFVEKGSATQSGGYRSESAQIQVSATEQGFNKRSKTVLDVQSSDETEVGSVDQRKAWRESVENPRAGDRPFYSTETNTQAPPPAPSRGLVGDRLLTEILAELDAARAQWERKHGVSISLARRVGQGRASSFPVVQEDTENAGTWVGRVEREQVTPMQNVPPQQQPPQPQPAQLQRSTFGSNGAVVFQEERHMGGIVTSSGARAPAQTLDAKAVVRGTASDPIQMAPTEVGAGGRQKMASSVSLTDGSEGVAVGRVLSPAVSHVDMTQVGSNAVQQIESKSLKVERFAVERSPMDTPVGRGGDTLEELMPEASATPAPKVNADAEKLAMIRQLIPDFEWDKDRPTMVRVKEAIEKYLKKPEYMRAIVMYETESCASLIKEEIARLTQG